MYNVLIGWKRNFEFFHLSNMFLYKNRDGKMLQELFPISDYQTKKFSFSRMELFHQCKLRYKLKYLDNRLDNDQKSSFYLSIGRFSHRVLKEFYDPQNVIRPDISPIMLSMWSSTGFKNKAEEDTWFNKSKENILKFINQDDLSKKVLAVEAPFETKLDQYVITTIIDRINEIDKDYCEIIEYKFGELNTSGISIEKNNQWLFHYLASNKDIKGRYNKEIAYIKYCFLDSGNTFIVYPTYALVERMTVRLKNAIDEVDNEKEFEPTINKFCVDCRFSVICPLKNKQEGKR